MSTTPTTEMPLSQIRELVAGLQVEADTAVAEVEEYSTRLYAAPAMTLQEVTANVERWSALAASLTGYKRRVARRRAEARLDFQRKFDSKVKHGPMGRLAAGSAWDERKAAAHSEFIVEWEKFELLNAAVEDLDGAVSVIMAHVNNVKYGRQADLRSTARDAKFASNHDYAG